MKANGEVVTADAILESHQLPKSKFTQCVRITFRGMLRTLFYVTFILNVFCYYPFSLILINMINRDSWSWRDIPQQVCQSD